MGDYTSQKVHPTSEVENTNDKRIVRGLADSIIVLPESTLGSESPRSIRSYHKGSNGTLTGGGVQKIYNAHNVDMKQYKNKLDRRLGLVVLGCLVTMATILCVYGVMHQTVHNELSVYVNRTHQIAKEMKTVMDDEYGKLDNKTKDALKDKEWIDVEQLEQDAYMLSSTNSTIWKLFVWNLVLALFLAPLVILVNCDFIDGNGVKIVYRVVLLVYLIFFFAQFFYLVHPILFGAVRFPGMVDRLFVYGYPRDEYKMNEMQDTFACEWNPHPSFVLFDVTQPCIPKIKNSLFPAYTVVMLIFIDLFPFVFAVFTYSWNACIKDNKHVKEARTRVELNTQRRSCILCDCSSSEMSACPLIVSLVAVFALTIFLLNKYGNWRKQHAIVTLSTFVGWYFSFLIILVLPLDVAITFYNRCLLEQEKVQNATGANVTVVCEEPGGLIPNDTLLTLWRIVYWTAQALTWLILPLMQSYATAGDFSASGKLKTALYNNAVYYGAYMMICVIILIYAVFKGVSINQEHLKVIVVSASNTWGLFLLVVLLGYGLVEIPRQLIQFGSRAYRINKTYFNIDKLSTEKNDAEDAVKETYKEARAVLNALKNDHFLRDKAQAIVSKFPDEVIGELFPSRSGADFQSLGEADKASVTNEKYLIRLHKRAIDAVQMHHRTAAQWGSLVHRALWLEDQQQAELTGKLDSQEYSILPEQFRFFWHVKAQRPACMLLGCFFTLMTIFILLSECTFFIVHPTLSPAALLIHYFAQGFHYKYTQLVAIVMISYLCVVAYYTVFRLRIYKYYHLDPHKHTDENSLLFSAILLCRLTPPICLNFIGMIHLDSHVTRVDDLGVETQFTKLMGHLDVLPVVSKGINIYLPMMILVFCTLTYYKFGTQLLHFLGIEQFVSDDDLTMEMVSAGRSLVNLERSKEERRIKKEKRDEAFTRNMQGTTDRLRGAIASSIRRSPSVERQPIIDQMEEGGYEYESLPIQDRTTDRGRTTFSEHPNSSHFFDDM